MLVVFLIVMSAIRQNAAIAESWTNTVSRGWVTFFARFTSLFSVSVFEIFALLVIAAILVGLVVGIVFLCRKKWRPVVTGLICYVLLAVMFVDVYTMTAGFAYYRDPVPVPQSQTQYSGSQTAEIARYYLDDFNALSASQERDSAGNVVSPYNLIELSEKIGKEFDKLNSDYFFDFTPTAKGLTNNWYLNIMHLSGISFLPTGEAHINTGMPASAFAHTVAHELAHTKGVMREGDANLIAYYLLLNSDDDYLRYCGYYICFSKMMTAVAISNTDSSVYAGLSNDISADIKTEWKAYSAYWEAFPDIMDKISDFFNSLYLKLNGASDGTGSYSDKWDYEDVTDPGTGQVVERNPTYSDVHKMFFYLYENK